MSTPSPVPDGQDRRKIPSRKVFDLPTSTHTDDSLTVWAERYLDLAVRGVRSEDVTTKIARHLERFTDWFTDGYGHDRVSAVTPREVAAWRDHLASGGNRLRDGTRKSQP